MPLFWRVDKLSKNLRCVQPRLVEVRSALLRQGYRVSGSHTERQALKTDAPARAVWDLMRCWVAQRACLTPQQLERGGERLAQRLARTPEHPVDLSEEAPLHPDSEPASRAAGLIRFQPNPQPDWGPKARAKPGHSTESLEGKRLRLQGRRHRPTDSQEADAT